MIINLITMKAVTFIRLIILLILSSIIVQHTFSQAESHKWIFGNGAGLDFNQWLPIVYEGSQMNAPAGCASICDGEGNLLLYSNGATVWNGNHQIIVEGLMGDPNMSQGVAIVPRPGEGFDNQYLIWTVDGPSGINGMRFSVIDLSLNNGEGGIYDEMKNIVHIFTGNVAYTERIVGVRNFDSKESWIIAHQWGTNVFEVIRINTDFLELRRYNDSKPSYYREGSIHGQSGMPDLTGEASGYLKVSSKGNKMAVAIEGKDIIELFDFNSKQGYITDSIIIHGVKDAYGIEFSPNEQYFYASQRKSGGGGNIYQWDITSRNEATVNATKRVVGRLPEGMVCGALQLSSNGKIYMAAENEDFLSVIHSPNNPWNRCLFFRYGIRLGDGRSGLGLPTYLSAFFVSESFIVSDNCLGDTTQFFLTSLTRPDEVSWDFGDGHVALRLDPASIYYHVYNEPGTYRVKMTTYRGGGQATEVTESVTIHPAIPIFDLGEDRYDLCSNDSIIITVNSNGTIEWFKNEEANPFSTADSVVIYENGVYNVAIRDQNFCQARDTVEVFFHELPIVDSIITTMAHCEENNGTATVYPDGNPEDFDYVWNTNPPQLGQTAVNLPVGTYSVTVAPRNSECNLFLDDINILGFNSPDVLISGVTDSVCPGSPVLLTATGAETYLWENGKTTDTVWIYPEEKMTFSVTGYVSDPDGTSCSSIAYISLNVLIPQPEQIDVVSVDEISQNNIIYWTKNHFNGINQYNIYKESESTDVYDLIGICPFDSMAVFIDSFSTPRIKSNLYKISSVDSCGTESELSIYHKTIHLSANFGVSGENNLNWNAYEGFIVDHYNIYRGTTLSESHLIGTVSGSNLAFSDLYPPLPPLTYYIEAVSGSTFKSTNLSSRSNVVEIGTTGINDINIKSKVQIFPNPANESVSITWGNEIDITLVQILDYQGKMIRILEVPVNSNKLLINIESLFPGTYILRINHRYSLKFNKQ